MSNPNQWRPIGRHAIIWTSNRQFFWGSFLLITCWNAWIFSRRWIQMNNLVNLFGNTTYHFRSLVYNARISRWWSPTTTILQLWAESADWIISRLQFHITKHTLKGNRKFKVVRLCSNRKYKDNVYRKMLVQEYLKKLRIFKKVKPQNDLVYQAIYNCICQNTKKIRFIIHYVNPTAQLLFRIRFPKGGPTCRRQVVNPRHQTPQGQSVAKPETPLQNIQVE